MNKRTQNLETPFSLHSLTNKNQKMRKTLKITINRSLVESEIADIQFDTLRQLREEAKQAGFTRTLFYGPTYPKRNICLLGMCLQHAGNKDMFYYAGCTVVGKVLIMHASTFSSSKDMQLGQDALDSAGQEWTISLKELLTAIQELEDSLIE